MEKVYKYEHPMGVTYNATFRDGVPVRVSCWSRQLGGWMIPKRDVAMVAKRVRDAAASKRMRTLDRELQGLRPSVWGK